MGSLIDGLSPNSTYSMAVAMWRMGGRGAARKLAAAAGFEPGVAMPVNGPTAK